MPVPPGSPPPPPRHQAGPTTGPPPRQLRPDPPVPLGSCAVCRFHDPTTGTCRRHAPMRLNIAGHPHAAWPQVTDTDWCGKWEPPMPGDRPGT